MNTSKKFFRSISANKIMVNVLRTLIVMFSVSALSGCLITSPFWNQEFASHTSVVPLQAWTTKKDKTVRFECSKAYHGGLYPAFGPESWVFVSNVIPDQTASLDPSRGKIYSAARDASLPAACWRQDPGNNIWYSAIRAVQDGNVYSTVNKTGLECVGRENGKAASWFGWFGKNCTQTYSNTNGNIPYVIFRAST